MDTLSPWLDADWLRPLYGDDAERVAELLPDRSRRAYDELLALTRCAFQTDGVPLTGWRTWATTRCGAESGRHDQRRPGRLRRPDAVQGLSAGPVHERLHGAAYGVGAVPGPRAVLERRMAPQRPAAHGWSDRDPRRLGGRPHAQKRSRSRRLSAVRPLRLPVLGTATGQSPHRGLVEVP
jgi:hypothetical protein